MFRFEEAEIGPDLDLVPLAARRALDHAGLKLSLQGWRSLGVEARRTIAAAGTADEVDTARVSKIVAHASPPAAAMASSSDPAAGALPEGVDEAALPLQQWSRLRPILRYALAHTAKRAARRGDPAILDAALLEIAGRNGSAQPRPSR